VQYAIFEKMIPCQLGGVVVDEVAYAYVPQEEWWPGPCDKVSVNAWRRIQTVTCYCTDSYDTEQH